MKNTIGLLTMVILIFLTGKIKAQSDCGDLFSKGITYANTNQNDSAIIYFKKAYLVCPQDTDLYGKAIFNVGLLYQRVNPDSAIYYFKSILQNKNLNDEDPSGNAGLMEDPYANYKYNSCYKLYGIFHQRGQLDSCLHYLQLANTVYTYKDWSGTDISIKKGYLKSEIAYITGMLGDVDTAYSMLAGYMKSDWYTFNSHIYFFQVLSNKYGDEVFENEFEKQLDKVEYPTILLFDYEIDISSLISEDKIKDEEEIKKLKEKIFQGIRND